MKENLNGLEIRCPAKHLVGVNTINIYASLPDHVFPHLYFFNKKILQMVVHFMSIVYYSGSQTLSKDYP